MEPVRKLKLMTIAGTRPELVRLSEIIKKADRYFDHLFVHTGQNYDERLNEIFYEDLKLRRPDGWAWRGKIWGIPWEIFSVVLTG